MTYIPQKFYRERKQKILDFYKLSSDVDFERLLIKWYLHEKLSGGQISERILKDTAQNITARSIQRILGYLGCIRSRKESFKLAIDSGRMVHPLKEWKQKRSPISAKRRYEVFIKCNFKCVVCFRSNYDDAFLEIDHIKAVCFGGTNELSNLQLLCHECNKMKQYQNNEFADVHNKRNIPNLNN